MSNVVPLKPSQPPIVTHEAPNQELIAHLEELLAFAKSGELRAIATVLCHDGDKIRTGWTTAAGEHDRLASGILTLMHRYGAATLQDAD